MKHFRIRSVVVALLLFAGAAICGAATVTVGPSGMYQDPCVAFANLADGDTVTIDANGGTPYYESAAEGQDTGGGTSGVNTCAITNNNLTIVGVNGRPIIDGTNANVQKGLWLVNGHDIVIDNIEMRNAFNTANDSSADAMRIQDGYTPGGLPPNGGNVTVQHCYIHDNAQGILASGSGIDPGTGTDVGEWYSANPYVTFQYDEFAFGGGGGLSNGSGLGHNFYIGYDTHETMKFTLQFSWTHDALYGHTVRDRAPISNILYNMIDDIWGKTSFEIDVPNGGSTYIVGNVVYKAPITSSNANANAMINYREEGISNDEPEYGPPYQDLHFINNTVINASTATGAYQFISEECLGKSDASTCPAKLYGQPGLTTPGVFENNIFMGNPPQITDDLTSLQENNVSYFKTYPNSTNLALLNFANPSALDFHIEAGSPAIQAGIYPPTDNTGAADMKAYAQYQYAPPAQQGAARPTPTGSTMDAGAFSYPPPTVPSLGFSYTTTVTAPTGTGTITVTGLPTPPAGQFNQAAFYSTNTSAIPYISSVVGTTSISTTFSTLPVATTTVVPIYVYVDGTILTANVTVNPGPDTLYSITLDSHYSAATTVHLSGPAPAGGAVVNLTSSDSSVVYIPSSITIPQGAITSETGSLIGSEWGQSPHFKSATITASESGSSNLQETFSFYSPGVSAFSCNGYSSCVPATGGQAYKTIFTMAGSAPLGGALVQVTSSNPAAIPNQSFTVTQGGTGPSTIMLSTNSVSSAQTVTLTASFNGQSKTTNPITVNPGDAPASVAVVSGSGQSANTGTPFANPLVTIVKDSSGNPLSGVLVTYSGTGVSFPSGNTATTDSNGDASVTAEPTQTGSLTVDATVSGVSSPAAFSETGTSPVKISSITSDGGNSADTTVNLNAAAPAGGAVVSLSSSDTTILWVPSTVTVPAEATSLDVGSMLGSIWGQTPPYKSATVTGTYNGTAQLTMNVYATKLGNDFSCGTCTVTGGNSFNVIANLSEPGAPYGGATETITSSNTAVIPNQTIAYNAGQQYWVGGGGSVPLTTNTVSISTNVTLTASYNGSTKQVTVTVNP